MGCPVVRSLTVLTNISVHGLSLLLAKLVTGENIYVQVEKTYQHFENQGISIISRMSAITSRISCQTLRHCFLIKFFIIYPALHRQAGIDAEDTMMA